MSRNLSQEVITVKDGSVLPCPFCGSDDIYYGKHQTLVGERWSVFCGNCMAEVYSGCAQDSGQARKSWNRRINGNNDQTAEAHDRA